jgi:hypothetical protein
LRIPDILGVTEITEAEQIFARFLSTNVALSNQAKRMIVGYRT